jgi:hypothetical protein
MEAICFNADTPSNLMNILNKWLKENPKVKIIAMSHSSYATYNPTVTERQYAPEKFFSLVVIYENNN